MPKELALMTIPQLAEILQVSRGTVYAMIHRGTFRVVKLGRATRIRRKDVEDFINQTPRSKQGWK